MWHRPSYTLELDCRGKHPPKEGQTFTLQEVTEHQFIVTHVAPYKKPQARPDGTKVTHHIRYIRKPGTNPEPQTPTKPHGTEANRSNGTH